MEAKLNHELQLFGKMPLDIQDTSDTAFKETTPEIWKTNQWSDTITTDTV